MLTGQPRRMAQPGSATKGESSAAAHETTMTRSASANLTNRASRRTRAVSLPVAGTALLLIDVINDLAFKGSGVLVAQAEPMAVRLAALKRRATSAGVPTIYINDNFGRWRSDFRQTVAHCTARSSPGRRVSQRLKPTTRDYFVLKPKHSGFFDTTLDTLLENLRIRRVILTGMAGNICVLFTANDAYMRDLKVFAPADCIVSNTAADNDHALQQIESVMKGHITPSTQITFRKASRIRRDSRP
jgi:nicotinamidase-related amidase